MLARFEQPTSQAAHPLGLNATENKSSLSDVPRRSQVWPVPTICYMRACTAARAPLLFLRFDLGVWDARFQPVEGLRVRIHFPEALGSVVAASGYVDGLVVVLQ